MTGQIQDKTYKNLFQNREIVESLLEKFIPEEIRRGMDLASLEPLPTEHIGERNQVRMNDILWRVKYRGGDCYLVIMLEFQSAEDYWMGFRVLEYVVLLMRETIRNSGLPKKAKLPLIFPMVIYNGDKKWTAPLDVRDHFPAAEAILEQYLPRHRFFLLDAKHLIGKLDPAGETNLSQAIFDFETSGSLEGIAEIIFRLAKVLPNDDKLQIHKAFINFLSCNIIDDPEISAKIIDCKTIQEVYMAFADTMPRWKANLLEEGIAIGEQRGFSMGEQKGIAIGEQKGIAIGEQKGIAIGEQRAIRGILLDALGARFGALPDSLVARIEAISDTGRLKELAVGAYSVATLDELESLLN